MNPQALLDALDHCERLNQDVLRRLGAGEALESLSAVFEAKQAALEACLAASQTLENGPTEVLGPVLEAQARVNKSETQVSLALRDLQQGLKNVKSVTKAYRSELVDKLGTKSLDLES